MLVNSSLVLYGNENSFILWFDVIFELAQQDFCVEKKIVHPNSLQSANKPIRTVVADIHQSYDR